MDRKKPARAHDPFGAEPKTAPSPSSGNYRARPVVVEEVVVPQTSYTRRTSTVREAAPKNGWAGSDEEVPTPRPNVTLASLPRVVMHDADLEALPLEPRAAFLLGLVDGKTRAQTLVDVSGMDENEVLELLARLLVFGVLAVDG